MVVHRFDRGVACATLIFSACVAVAGENEAPIATALETVDEEVILYNDHLTTLASPFMEGRLPGTRGMERAKEYCEHYFAEAGLEPGFGDTYRQPFELGGTMTVTSAKMAGLVGGEAIEFEWETDFNVTGMGTSGAVTAPAVFVGYSVDNEDYSSFNDDDDFTGKIALMVRFEPMNDVGDSRFTDGAWSNAAAFRAKLRTIRDRNPAAVVIINPPESSDPRAEMVLAPSGGGGKMLDVPVMFMSIDAGDKLCRAMDPEGRSLLDLRRLADRDRTVVDFNGILSLKGQMDREEVLTENVGGLLRGRGELADELIVVGGHLDHLGMGYFGSRSGPGKLHPGADDNASGSAGVLLFAKKMAESYNALPETTPLRSVLFICFSAEESGLNGSRHYANNPIMSVEDHVLMINFDMIGRIQEGRLSVSGMSSGEGMKEWVEPYFDASPLDVVAQDSMNGASDHTSFYNKNIPVIFGIIADFHSDYHTPEDVSSKINRVGAVETIRLFHDIAMGMAQRPERFQFAEISRSASRGPAMGDIKVRFGVMPGSYEEGMDGVPIAGTSPGGAAEEAGVQDGDVLVRWDGQKIGDVMSWMEMLAKHEPGDVVKVGVKRDGEELTLDVKLQAR